MTTNRSADAKKIDLVKLKYWFGPPPLDLGDDERAFDDYVCELAKCMEPEDRVVEVLVYRFGLESWKQMRLLRIQAYVVRRRDEALIEFGRKHVTNVNLERQNRKGEVKEIVDEFNDPKTTSMMVREEAYHSFTVAEDTNREIKHAAAFEKGLDVYERIDVLISQSAKRASDILRQIEFYRIGLAEKLRRKHQTTVETLKGELAEKRVDPPLIPEMDGSQ